MSAKVIQVIHEQVTEGEGTPDDPFRTVHRFYEFDGTLIAERDPFMARKDLGYRGRDPSAFAREPDYSRPFSPSDHADNRLDTGN